MVDATLRHQFLMGPCLNDIAIIKHDHTVGIMNGREAMGDDQRSTTLQELL